MLVQGTITISDKGARQKFMNYINDKYGFYQKRRKTPPFRAGDIRRVL